jgi:hypothetical protein
LSDDVPVVVDFENQKLLKAAFEFSIWLHYTPVIHFMDHQHQPAPTTQQSHWPPSRLLLFFACTFHRFAHFCNHTNLDKTMKKTQRRTTRCHDVWYGVSITTVKEDVEGRQRVV